MSGETLRDRPAEVDLTGLPPQQALALGALTAELIAAAEARGYQKASETLRGASTRLLVLQHLWATGGSCSCGWKDDLLPYGVHLASVFAGHLEAGGQLRHPALATQPTDTTET